MLRLMIFDRDDTIVCVPKGIKYLCGDAPIELVPGIVELLIRLNSCGVVAVVATNQPGIEKSNSPEDLAKTKQFNDRLEAVLARAGAKIDRFYVCPHLPSDGCNCHKPRPGMFL